MPSPTESAAPKSGPEEKPATEPPTKRSPTREQRLVLIIAIVASFVTFLDGTVVNVTLPAIADELGGGIALQQWVVDAYLITLGALILVAGSVSDVYGRIRVLRIGAIAFGLASLAVAVAPSAPLLIVARLLQGAAGALLVPSSLALIMSSFRGAAQAKAIGTWTAITSAAFVFGPILGGLFVEHASWRWAFVINLIPAAAVIWLLPRLTQRDTRLADTRIDFLGAVLGAVGLGGAVYALIELPTHGASDPTIWIPGAIGVAAIIAFLVHQARAAHPMMPLGLFRIRNFGWGNVATALVYGGLSLVSFVMAVYLQEGAGLSAVDAGLATLPIVVMLIMLSSPVGALARRFGPRIFMTVGPIVAAAGVLLTLSVAEDFNYWTQVFPGVLLVGVGMALTVSPLTSAILGAINTARSGIASAINNAVSRVAGLVVVALVGSIVGGQLDLDGFHRAAVVTAVALVAAGAVSWAGIRNRA